VWIGKEQGSGAEVRSQESGVRGIFRDSYPLTAETEAAGGVLTAKRAPHRPGTAPAPGLRADCVVAPILPQTALD